MRLLLISAILLTSLVPQLADAQDSPSVVIAEIREMIQFARFDDAVTAAGRFLERGDLDANDRNIGLEVLATAHVAHRDQERADAVLSELYARDPGHRLSDADASPLVQAAFQRARERHPETVEVTLIHEPPSVAQRESPMVEVRVGAGLHAVQEVRLAYRTGGAPRFARLVMNLDERGIARGRIPLVGAPNAEQQVQYFILALAPSMTPLGQLGDEAEPLALSIPAQSGEGNGQANLVVGPDVPVVEEEDGGSKWWIALIVVGIVAAAGVGGYFLFREDAPNGTLGSITLR